MAPFLEQKPKMIDTEMERSKMLSWAAVLMDRKFDMHAEAQRLNCQLIGAGENKKHAISKVLKLLIVSEPTQTNMCMT